MSWSFGIVLVLLTILDVIKVSEKYGSEIVSRYFLLHLGATLFLYFMNDFSLVVLQVSDQVKSIE